MARPVLDPDKKKTSSVYFRCTSEEKKALVANAKALNMDLTQFLMDRGLDRKFILNRVELVGEISKVGTEISRIGNNINQLAKHVNTESKGGKVDPNWMNVYETTLQEYLNSYESLRSVFRKLLRDLA